MAGSPVIQKCRTHVTDQVQFCRAATDVFRAGIDEINADVIARARPTVGGQLIHHAAVTVFVLDGIFVDARAQDALLLHVNDDARTQIPIVDHEHIAVGINGEPVERRIHLENETTFAFTSGGITGRVRIYGISIKTADATFQSVTHFDVHPPVHALHSHFAAFAAIFSRVNRYRRRDLAGRHLLPVFAATHDAHAVIHQRRHIAVVLVDDRPDNAVVQDPLTGTIGHGYGGTDFGFGNLRLGISGTRYRNKQCHGNKEEC